MEDGAEKLERTVGITHTIAMSQEELMAVNFCSQRFLVQYHATLLLQIIVCPDVVVACKEMDLDTHIRQLRQLPQEARITLGNDIFVFIPEIKHVTQKIDGSSLLLDAVKKTHQSALLHPLMRDGP